MGKFQFNIDRKCTIWYREYHEIEANDYSEAANMMLNNFRLIEKGRTANDDTFLYQEEQGETLEDMLVKDNNGWPTAELINPEGDTIADNTI